MSDEIEDCAERGLTDVWRLRVAPVPSPLRASVKASAIAEGLPRLKAWLKVTRSLDNREGAYFRILLHEGHHRLLSEERLNRLQDAMQNDLGWSEVKRGAG